MQEGFERLILGLVDSVLTIHTFVEEVNLATSNSPRLMPTFRGLRRGSANGACYDVGVSRSRTDSALVGGPGSHELSVNPKLEERAREEKRGRERWEILRFPTAAGESDDRK